MVRANLSTRRKSKRTANGFHLCTRQCKSCVHCGVGASERIKTHKCHRTGQEWQISAPMTCLTPNVIYKITCRKCPHFVYIGETERRFCDRFTDHRGYVNRNKTDQPVGAHFNLPGHTLEDLVAFPIERVFPRDDTMLRRRREKLWIKRYDSSSFHGANSRD